MKKSTSILWGIALIVGGGIFALNSLGITSINIFFTGWWTLFIIIPCTVGLFTEKKKFGNLVGIAFGVFLLLCARDILDFDMIWKLFLPVVVVCAGLKLVFTGIFGKKKPAPVEVEIHVGSGGANTAVFSGSEINYAGQEFTGRVLLVAAGKAAWQMAKAALDTLERVDDGIVITNAMVTERLQQNPLAYDKDGEMHYDIVSAYIKSIRGSDPDGALYWLARMIQGGEDPAFIARRLVISASEDIGLANPNALLIANAAFDAVMKIGWPEGRIPLAEATVYLATSPKSNSAYMGINTALSLVEQTGNLPVPLHLRNAPTKLMKELGYSEGYKYAHDYDNHFVKQQFLPDEINGTQLWTPQPNAAEDKLKERMKFLWGK